MERVHLLSDISNEYGIFKATLQARCHKLNITGELRKVDRFKSKVRVYSQEEVDKMMYKCPDLSKYYSRFHVQKTIGCSKTFMDEMLMKIPKRYFSKDGKKMVRYLDIDEYRDIKEAYELRQEKYRGGKSKGDRWSNAYGSPQRITG